MKKLLSLVVLTLVLAACGLYFADPASLSPRKVNALPPSLSELFWSETGIVWSPAGT